MNVFDLGAAAADLVARLRIEQQDLQGSAGEITPGREADFAALRGQFAAMALELCELHADPRLTTSAAAPSGGAATAGLSDPSAGEQAELHLTVQDWTGGATFALCGRALIHQEELPDPASPGAGRPQCDVCFGRRPACYPQILTAAETEARHKAAE